MSFRLYNSFSKKEEVFVPSHAGEVSMYTCGPTVYGRPHIGNYSSFLMADLLRRWLEVSGYRVTHVKNITDVGHLVADADEGEDKIERQAREENIDPLSIARKYTEQYLADERALGLIEPEYRPKATETIPEMIEIIRTLVERGSAYETEDGVYFSVETFPSYGALSGNTLEQLNAGARIEVNERKRHPADFALWKKTVGSNAKHLLKWPSPWGEGFPGWHIECSAMSRKHLGLTVDIHTGGEDNIFPHHECEIAQSECSGSHPFVRYWLHRRRIEIVAREDGHDDAGAAKMSKSLGNVLSIDDIIARGYSPMDLRYLLLSVHYRTRLKFSWKGMDDAKKARLRILEWMTEKEERFGCKSPTELPTLLRHTSSPYIDQFRAAMDDDLNVSAALATVFDTITQTRRSTVSSQEQCAIGECIAMIRHTFGCFHPHESVNDDIPADIRELFTEREAARSAKNFQKSDDIRATLEEKGFIVTDGPEGSRLKRA